MGRRGDRGRDPAGRRRGRPRARDAVHRLPRRRRVPGCRRGGPRSTVLALDDGTRVLRFEDLVTDNGPDLKVYLSAAGPDAPSGELDDVFVDVGRLAGNLGNQNYPIPAEADLARYASVVIWCDRFDVAFGASPLAPDRAG